MKRKGISLLILGMLWGSHLSRSMDKTGPGASHQGFGVKLMIG